MELTTEVKGIIAKSIADIFSHPKIALFAMSIGVDPEETMEIKDKNGKAVLILNKVPKENAEIVIKTIFEMSKKGTWNNDYSEEIRNKINFVMERTMNCRTDENGEIVPIFDLSLKIEEKQSYLEGKLNDLGFIKSLSHYQGAIKVYKASPKGSISLLRSTFETLVDEILVSQSISHQPNFKEKLKRLQDLGILIRINHRNRDSELNFAYDFYSLLSHYGSHTELVTEPVANWLYTSISAFIWFLLNRYERLYVIP